MTTMYGRGRVKGKTVVLNESIALPDDAEVDVILTPVMSAEEQKSRLVATVEAEPRLTVEDGEALMRAIEEVRKPPAKLPAFPDRNDAIEAEE